MGTNYKIVHAFSLVSILLATSCATGGGGHESRSLAAPTAKRAKVEFANRENVVTALQTNSTVTVVVEEWLIPGRDDKFWHNTAKKIVGNLFGYAKMQIVDSGGDMNVRLSARFEGASADYVQSGPTGISLGGSPPIKMMTGGDIAGQVTFIKGETVVGSFSFRGHSSPPSMVTLGTGENPVIAALSSSNFFEDFLDVLAHARGPDTLQRIVDENKMVLSISPDLDGRMGAYRAVFGVLAKSSEEWAGDMLTRLSQDTESPSAKRLADDALRKRETRR
jgi:hypothetical protein